MSVTSSEEIQAILSIPTFPLDDSVKTLGWEIVAWMQEMLVQPDGENAGEPFTLTREQINFILWFYAVDEAGKFTYRRGVLRRSKGWGKSPFLGALCLAELCGPVRFSHFDDDGEPAGKQHPMPWVQIAGVSEVQTQNTMTAILALLENAPAVDEYGLDVGMTRIYRPGGGRLIPISASSSTQEGTRPSFVIMDETHHWTEGNGGWALARVIRRNLGKSRDGSARSIETTNAHAPGGDTVAEASYLDYLAIKEGRSKNTDVLYDSREAPGWVELHDEEQLMAGLRAAYGDSIWVDLERIKGEIWDLSTPPEESRRFYLNQIVASRDAWLSPADFDKNYDPDLEPLTEKDTIVLGFDGSLTDDSTALVASRISDGAPFVLGLWENPGGKEGQSWEVDKEIVRGVMDNVMHKYDVIGLFCDVAFWEADVDRWRQMYGEKLLIKATTKHATAYDMRSHQGDTVKAAEALNRALVDGTLPHNGDLALRRHVLNARLRANRWGVTFGKETRESPKKVDLLAAWVLANMARNRVLAEDILSKRRRRTGILVGFG